MNENKNIKLFHGDCLEIMDQVIKDGVKVDAIITDPPYGMTACKWDMVIPFDEMWSRLKALRKEHTPIVLFGSEPFSSILRMSNIKEFKYDWIWEKSLPTGFLNAWKQPLRKTEIITVFYKKQCYYNPQIKDKLKENIRPLSIRTNQSDCYGEHKLNIHKLPNNKTLPNNILKFNNQHKAIHSTQKPLKLMEYLVKTYTNENDLILDFTCGSGTTGVACVNLNRKFIGIDNGYCERKESKFYKKSWVEVADYRIKQSLTLFDK